MGDGTMNTSATGTTGKTAGYNLGRAAAFALILGAIGGVLLSPLATPEIYGPFPGGRSYPLGDGVTCLVVSDGFGPWVDSCTRGEGPERRPVHGAGVFGVPQTPDGSERLVTQFMEDAKDRGWHLAEHGWRRGILARLSHGIVP